MGQSRHNRWITPAERFEAFVEPEPNSGCWLFAGKRTDDGYGLFSVNKRRRLAHRVAYELARGSIATGTEIDHLCRMRCCVNPAHMEAVSHPVNIMRGVGFGAVNALKTHCPRGHPLTDKYHGGRRCIECRSEQQNAAQARYRLRQKAAGVPHWRHRKLAEALLVAE